MPFPGEVLFLIYKIRTSMIIKPPMSTAGIHRIIINLILILFFYTNSAISQSFRDLRLTANNRLSAEGILLSDGSVSELTEQKPLFSFVVNGKYISSGDLDVTGSGNSYIMTYNNTLKVTYSHSPDSLPDWTGEIIFENTGSDTVIISNVVPFGEDTSSVYITGFGNDYLARACLFRPGFRPVRVILPDNAWELGYSSFTTRTDFSVCALTRRQKIEGGLRKRYETLLPVGSKVYYKLYAEIFRGEWQEGLRLMFRDRYLYDLEKFDNALYERKDIAWIKESYLIILQMAWDREFYDRLAGKYAYGDFLKREIETLGGIDVYALWPTWPRLGLDQRNQWDLYRDLPGGTEQLRNIARISRPYGTRFFIEYNPWDNSTRKENQLSGMAQIISETEADGVVLDTRGSSSYELQAAADSVRKGVVMYSEGMAIPKDMPGIISGRVHNAIYLSPELNLNKLIKPDFAIFRVCDAGEDILHREIAIAFFNGYGTEVHLGRPGGRGESYYDDMEFLARTTFILRQNNDAFLDYNWTPLIGTLSDNVYVNKWNSGEKTIYTVLNMKPGGVSGKLFNAEICEGSHFISLWNHDNLDPEFENGKVTVSAMADSWHSIYSGTRREGSVECIAEFPVILRSRLEGDSLKLTGSGNGRTLIWKGNPSHKTVYKELKIKNDTVVRIKDLFDYYEGKIVVQLLVDKRLKDENVHYLKGGKPWIITTVEPTKKVSSVSPEMVLVPGTIFSYDVTTTEDFILYPDVSGKSVKIDSFLIDKYPVTNAQYFDFIVNSGYYPRDTTRYLKNWESGTFRQGQDKYPVVYISYEDMQAYAKWVGKRLPTQAEWQLAAQGTDKRKWPWGDEFHGTYCNNSFDRPTPVDAFPKGQSPYGAMDLVGNVWQTTNDMYFDGSYYFTVIRGGSYYHPDSSWWYIQGGPQQLDKTQIMLLVSPGFDRSATVGFRCVKDIDAKNFKAKR
jgi:formylglycine-generating enzyme required for sulfatase activity